ncbi:MAG: PVC-type heme-binding CxxCH protein [Isosphaeraceae bacterium]
MIGARLGLWIALSTTMVGQAAPKAEPPRSVDPRLVFERIAAEPEIVTPTGLAIDGRGRILVIESHTHFRPKDYKGPPADRIRLFEDRDGDGKPECVGNFFEGTRFTMNLAVATDGSVFVATRWAVYRLEDRDGDGRADGTDGGKIPKPIVRLDTPGDYPHNGLSGFAFDFLGWVYFGLGENLGADYRLIGSDGITLSGGGEGGSIYRCRPDGTKLERFATGFWNPFHMASDHVGRLFAVDNDPDSRPPCRLLHIVEGGDYGYRFRNGRKGLHPFTAWNGELPGTLGMVAGTGEAPSGIVSYESDNLPADYRGSLLVTSWGDHRIERYDPQPRGASFRATMKPVVVGGDDFRPVGIAVAKDGTLYMSDWVSKDYTLHGKGRIWRLRNVRSIVGEVPHRVTASDIARSEIELLAARATLAERQGLKDKVVSDAVHHVSDAIRGMAIRIIPANRFDLKGIAVADASPLVRAEAMRRLADPTAKDLLLKALESDDPFIQQAARLGLKKSLGTDELVALAGSRDLVPSQRLGLLLILRDSDRPEARALLPKFLADADPSIRFAAIQWVGEHRLESFRPQLMAALASTAATRELFEATLAALDRLDVRRDNPRDELAGEDYIVSLLRNPQTPASIVRRGLRMLRPDHPALTAGLLKRFIESPDEPVRLEAVRSLAQSPQAGRFEWLGRLAGEATLAECIRAEAIDGLAEDASRHRERLLAVALNTTPALRQEALRSLRGVALSEPELTRLREASRGDDASLALIDRLGAGPTHTDHKPPAASDLDAWLTRLEGPADDSAGERVFFHPKGPGCYRCHQVDGRGGRIGPDLSTLATSTDRRRLVESIVAPSREIAPQFVPWSVAKTDGTVFNGILLEQSPEGALVFADSQGRRIAVRSDEIAERKPQTTSIMPEELVTTMTIQEFRDLLAFLGRRPLKVDPYKAPGEK